MLDKIAKWLNINPAPLGLEATTLHNCVATTALMLKMLYICSKTVLNQNMTSTYAQQLSSLIKMWRLSTF